MPADSLDVGGLVTGAAYSEELGQVVLSGYKDFMPFLYLLFDYHANYVFSGNKRKILMPGIFGAQTEGICFSEGYDGFISCEESLLSQRLFSFSTAEWTDTTLLQVREPLHELEVEVHPNPVDNGTLYIDIYNSSKGSYNIKIYDSSGKVVFSREYQAATGSNKQSFIISIPEVRPGIYLLHILSGDFYAREMVIVR
jgi:hypothetical protein